MFKIKEYFKEKKQYRDSKRALTLLLINQYSDFLETETKTKEAELRAYESMEIFGSTFKTDDLQKMLDNVNIIANNPTLTTDYYKQVNKNAHIEKETEKILKAIK